MSQIFNRQNVTTLIKTGLNKHDIKNVFLTVSVLHLNVWIKYVNSKLKHKQMINKLSIDTIKIYASRKFEKQRNYLKKVANMKHLQN